MVIGIAIMHILMLIFLLCLAVKGIIGFLYASKIIDANMKKAERDWYFTKTWLGRIQLEWGRRLAKDEVSILTHKIGGLVLAAFALLVFTLLLSKLGKSSDMNPLIPAQADPPIPGQTDPLFPSDIDPLYTG